MAQLFTLLGRDGDDPMFPYSILVQNVVKKKAESERDNIYRPEFGGDYKIHPTSFVFEHRGNVFYQLGRGRDCVWCFGNRVRFGNKEEIQEDIDHVLEYGFLPPKGNIW